VKREYLQLLHKRGREHILGWLASEKLDGGRAFWDGGASRGLMKSSVPYANLWRDKKDYVCTGLWSRLGNVIAAPSWWLDTLPDCLLDGELLIGDGSRQQLMSVIKRDTPGFGWDNVRYHIFDSPPPTVMFAPGVIDTPNMHVVLGSDCLDWWESRWSGVYCSTSGSVYKSVYGRLASMDLGCVSSLVPQKSIECLSWLDDYVAGFVAAGGEGVVVRNPLGRYVCGRVRSVLKVKPRSDMEGVVVGWKPGVGKLLGMMGSLTIRLESGVVMDLSGFTEAERRLPCKFENGDVVTFRYRGFTDGGVPQEAAYWRNRD